ncbi:MAG: hypothetical protein Q9163_001172 [Psora crenata]
MGLNTRAQQSPQKQQKQCPKRRFTGSQHFKRRGTLSPAANSTDDSGEEVLHLPNIVEAAESSPAAATQAAVDIRKFLSLKHSQRAYVQYNAIMLVRILAENPGRSFTRNIDTKFVTTVKELLRYGRDMSVQQILRETLDAFEMQRANDETLASLREMWRKEKAKMEKSGSMPPNYYAQNSRSRDLPPPAELAQRVEEAKTSAKLLSQVVQSTPPAEVLANDLIKEFAERCQSASRSMQRYIHSDNPAPDEDTLLTLIETNDQLATAMSKHQRALLQSRRMASSTSPGINAQNPNGPFEAPASQPAGAQITTFAAPPGPPPGKLFTQYDQSNPFADRNEAEGPPGNPQALLVEQNYGLPPASIATPTGANATTNPSMERTGDQPEEQPTSVKPRYRF